MKKAEKESEHAMNEVLRLQEFNTLEQRVNLIELELQSRDHVLMDEKHRNLTRELSIQESRSREFEEKKNKTTSRRQELDEEIESFKVKQKEQQTKKDSIREKKNEAAIRLKRTKLESNQLESYLESKTEKAMQEEKKQIF